MGCFVAKKGVCVQSSPITHLPMELNKLIGRLVLLSTLWSALFHMGLRKFCEIYTKRIYIYGAYFIKSNLNVLE